MTQNLPNDGADDRTVTRGPRRRALYSDSRRGLWALVAILPFLAVYLVLALLDPSAGVEETVSRTLLSSVIVLVVLTVTLYGMTLYAFAGLRGTQLRDAVLVEDRRERGLVRWVSARPWLRFSVTGGSAPVWSVQIAALSLILATVLAVSPALRETQWALAAVVVSLVANVLSIWVAYGLHYARIDHRDGGLRWPTPEPAAGAGGEAPAERAFADYLYLSAITQIGYSSGDVTVTGTRLRRVMTSHVAIGFVLNAVVIAILVAVLLSVGA